MRLLNEIIETLPLEVSAAVSTGVGFVAGLGFAFCLWGVNSWRVRRAEASCRYFEEQSAMLCEETGLMALELEAMQTPPTS